MIIRNNALTVGNVDKRQRRELRTIALARRAATLKIIDAENEAPQSPSKWFSERCFSREVTSS